MDDEAFYTFESRVFDLLEGKLSELSADEDKNKYIEAMAKAINPAVGPEDIKKLIAESKSFGVIDKYLYDDSVEDIMINSISNIFLYIMGKGSSKALDRIQSKKELDLLIKKMRMYAMTVVGAKRIFDVQMPNGSRANIVDLPSGADVTIRNFKKKTYSIIDLINLGELSYNMAGRFWLYVDGLKVRPANMLIGGMPAVGKTSLLNAMFSFFRPEQRVVVIEETPELNLSTQENAVKLETTPDLPMVDLVKNALRMRPDTIILGEVRGVEAKDLMTAMNIGKIAMGTIHASTAKDVITRLSHSPMNIEPDAIQLIDAIIIIAQVNEGGKLSRKITQVSEISGMEQQVLLSDLYSYDYKTRKASDMLPSITYRDSLARLTGYTPLEIVMEEQRRGKILEKLNENGVRDLRGINEFVKAYYENPTSALAKIGLQGVGTL